MTAPRPSAAAEPVAFRAVIESAGGGGAYVALPFDVEAHFGRKRVPVRATIDGAPYRGTLVRRGGPGHLLVVLKAIRARIGKGPGDWVDVTVEADDDPREVAVPPDLRAALDAAPEAGAFFEGLAYTHRREYVGWIEEARRAETRRARVEKAVAMLRERRKER